MGNKSLRLPICIVLSTAVMVVGCRTGKGLRTASTVEPKVESALALQDDTSQVELVQGSEPVDEESENSENAELISLPKVEEFDVDALVSLVKSRE